MARIKNHEHWIADREELAQHMRDVRETRMKPIRMKRWLINRMANLKTKEDVEKFELKPWDIMDWEHSSFTDSPHGDEIFLNELVPKLKEGLIKKINQKEKASRLLETFLKRTKGTKDDLDFMYDFVKRIDINKSLVRRILKIIDMKNPDALRNFQDSEIKKKAKKKEKELRRAEYKKLKKKVKPIRERGRKERIKRLRRREEERDILLHPKAIDNKQAALEDRIRKAGLLKKTWKRGDLYDKIHAYRAGRERWNRVLRILEVEGVLVRSSEKGRKNETITFL